MKKIIYSGIFCFLALISCEKEQTKQLTNIEAAKANTENQRASNFNVVHNGKTLSVNENAVLAHLQHGDKFGLVEDNVQFQGIVLSETTISLNDPIYQSYRYSLDYRNFDASLFGSLDSLSATIVNTMNGRKAIRIPIISKDGSISETALVGYVAEKQNQLIFSSLVIRFSDGVLNSTTEVASINFSNISGKISYFDLQGNLMTKIIFENNQLIDIEILPGQTCFKDCFRRSANECAGSFPCALICGLVSSGTYGTGWPIAIAACCSLDCALTGQSQNCKP